MTARYAVVIPTLQRAPQLAGLVAAFEADPLVAEILVVNNAPQPLPLGSSRTRVLHRPENIFVNPAWNLGVQCTTAPLLAIANDDIVLPAGLLAAVTRRLARGAGIVGAHPSCFGGPPRRPRVRFRPTYHRPYGYGTLMFLPREHYHRIPEELAIYCGDDYLYDRQRQRNYSFAGVHLGQQMSVTSRSEPRFERIGTQDMRLFHERHESTVYLDGQRWLLGHRAAVKARHLRERMRRR